MRTKLICYSLSGLTAAERVAFRRCIYGFKDHSNRGKYLYRRTGIMDSIPHRKILDCVIIVRDSDANKVAESMRKCKATIQMFPILAPFKL